MGQFQMGYSRVLWAPQTGSISMHVLLSFSPVEIMMKRITEKIKLGCDKNK
jgi:hypothetical protein